MLALLNTISMYLGSTQNWMYQIVLYWASTLSQAWDREWRHSTRVGPALLEPVSVRRLRIEWTNSIYAVRTMRRQDIRLVWKSNNLPERIGICIETFRGNLEHWPVNGKQTNVCHTTRASLVVLSLDSTLKNSRVNLVTYNLGGVGTVEQAQALILS